MSRDLSAWLAEARALLAAAHGPQAGPVSVRVAARSGARVVFVTGEGGEGGPAVPALSPDEAAVVRVLLGGGNRPLVAKKLAARAGLGWSGDVRHLLANLTKRQPPVLASGPLGYVVVGELAAGLPEPGGDAPAA